MNFYRKSRNLSEKKRRDQFNTLISELNSVVSTNGKKMDKSTILKEAMNTLKIYSGTPNIYVLITIAYLFCLK